jgi:hypothetical protein
VNPEAPPLPPLAASVVAVEATTRIVEAALASANPVTPPYVSAVLASSALRTRDADARLADTETGFSRALLQDRLLNMAPRRIFSNVVRSILKARR